MAGAIRSGQTTGPTGDYATDLANGWIQLRTPSPAGQIAPFQPTASNIYVPDKALVPWQTALAAALAGTGIASVMFAGASTSQAGSAVSNVITKSTPAQWRQDKINSGYPLGGDFFISTYSAAWSNNPAPNGWPFVNNIAPNAWLSAGPWWVPQYNTAGVTLATAQMSYVHPSTDLGYNARSLRVYYYDPSGAGGFSFKINTAQSEIGATVVTLLGDERIHFVDFIGLPNSAGNSLFFGNQSNGVDMLIIGVLACPGTAISTKGVFYTRTGNNGHCMGDLAYTGNTHPSDKIARYIGPSNAAPPFTPDPTLAAVFSPDLFILEPLDDFAVVSPGTTTTIGVAPTVTPNGWAADRYLDGLRRMTQAVERKPSGCTVVHELFNVVNNAVSDTTIAAAFEPQNAWEYFEVTDSWARRSGHIVSYTDANWKSLGVTYGFLTPGNPHPNDLGAGFGDPLGSPPAYLNVQARAARWKGIGL